MLPFDLMALQLGSLDLRVDLGSRCEGGGLLASGGLTCCFILQLGLLQALVVLYLDHLHKVTLLLLQPDFPAALGNRDRDGEPSPSPTACVSSTDSRSTAPSKAPSPDGSKFQTTPQSQPQAEFDLKLKPDPDLDLTPNSCPLSPKRGLP